MVLSNSKNKSFANKILSYKPKYFWKGCVFLKTTQNEYSKMSAKVFPRSPILKNITLAFISGGTICTIGQLLMTLYETYFSMTTKEARAAVSVTLVGLGALLTALKVYDNIAKHAGAGTLVPITGFANSIVAPAIEFKSEGHVMGIGAKMFIIAGPVLVFGITASVVYGLIVWIFKLF